MNDLNNFSCTGRLTKSPEMKFLPSGNAVLEWTVAINKSYKSKSGEWVNTASFIDCQMFGNGAQTFERLLTKGSFVAMTAEIKQDTWSDKQTGQKRSKISLVVDKIAILDKKEKGEVNGNIDNDPYGPGVKDPWEN